MFDLLVSKPEAIAAIANTVAAFGSVAVAIIAIFVSIKALRHQREHNKLSVKPLAQVLIGDYENRVYVKLVNTGTGPMIIKSIKIINAPDPSRPLKCAMPPGVNWTQYLVTNGADRSMRPGGDIFLVRFQAAFT
jgi:hypothetical protein